MHAPLNVLYPSSYPPTFCRNLENIQADKTPGFIPEVLKLLRVCAIKVTQGGGRRTQGEPLPKFWGDSPRGGFSEGRFNSALFFWQLKTIQEDERSRMQLENGMLYALHLCECFFDPYQTWRRQLSG